jgi:hypothetical protein
MSILRLVRNFALLAVLALAAHAAAGANKHPKPGPGRCGVVGQQCGAPILPPCCPGLVCVPASTRAFCEK